MNKARDQQVNREVDMDTSRDRDLDVDQDSLHGGRITENIFCPEVQRETRRAYKNP